LSENRTVLITGATGYIAGRLIPLLLERGYPVRCLVRDMSRIRGRDWYSQVEFVDGDIASCESLEKALEGVYTAYYLVHSMTTGRNYPALDLTTAQNFASAASQAGVEHIIYLGGLVDPEAEIGLHMHSRIQTGEALRQGTVPVTEFRASVIIGSGSTSFEMIRFLTEQIPVLVGPVWLRNRAQPISIQNVLDYLLAALENRACRGRIFEIGGRDVITYAETMLIYARLRGLKRRLLTMPVIPLGWMAFLVDRLTPIPASIAYPLIDGMRSDSVVRDEAARRFFPHVQLLDYTTAVKNALGKLSPSQVMPVWDNGGDLARVIKHEGFFIEVRQVRLDTQPEAVFRAFTRLGGKHGWLYLNSLWQLRGLFDRLMGGPGMRGRRDDESLNEGEKVDFYNVETLVPDRMLRLRAEVKAPGLSWMEWRVKPVSEGGALFSQLVFFAPKGVLGFLYWYALYPIHHLVFEGLFKKIKQKTGQFQ